MNKTTKKILKITAVIGAVVGTMHLINVSIDKAAKLLNNLKTKENNYYKWRMGGIYYEKTGSGSPILLIHDFTPYSSSYEWTNIVTSLAEDHTVYAIDLLGCGRSDKPAIDYTNFMYVQMLTDFINDVIGETTDIITSGYSSSIALMTTNYTSDKVGKLFFINPADIDIATSKPNICAKTVKKVLDTPIIGTFAYNMFTLRENIDLILTEKYLYNPFHVSSDMTDTYYNAAHYNGRSNGKYVLSSIIGNYMEANLPHVLKTCNHPIYIIGGKYHENIDTIINQYKHTSDNITSIIIDKTKKLPHYENADTVLDFLQTYLYVK